MMHRRWRCNNFSLRNLEDLILALYVVILRSHGLISILVHCEDGRQTFPGYY